VTLAAPVWLHLLWGVAILAGVAFAAHRARTRALDRLFAAGVLADRVPQDLARRRSWTATLALLGLALVALAATQPRWGYTWRELRSEGVEVVLVLDVSRSMDAQDVEPSRLERARREIEDLLDELRSDRVGLVIFAGGAYPRVPLTLDHQALLRVVRETDSQVIQAQGSSLAAGLREAVPLFSDAARADRAVVVLSDGESWDRDLDEAVQALEEAGVRVYSLGIGTTRGAPIPLPGGGFKKDDMDSVVLTSLQEEALERVAEATGGAHVRSVAGGADTAALATRIHAELEVTTTAVRRDKVWDERFQWPLAGGLGLLLLGSLIVDGRTRRPLAGLALVGLLAGAPAQAQDLGELVRQQVVDPRDPQVSWALARALYEAGRYDEASRVFTDLADRAPGPEWSLGARYNSGLSHYGAGRLEEAVADWDRVVEQAPEHTAAKENADAVRQELARRLQEPPPEEQQGEDGQDQEGGDTGQGEPQEPEAGDTGQPQDAQPTPQEEESSSDGTREQVEPTEQDAADEDGEITPVAEPGDTGPAEEGAVPEGVQEMSPEEAARLLETVEEGNPHVVVRGRSYGKDW